MLTILFFFFAAIGAVKNYLLPTYSLPKHTGTAAARADVALRHHHSLTSIYAVCLRCTLALTPWHVLEVGRTHNVVSMGNVPLQAPGVTSVQPYVTHTRLRIVRMFVCRRLRLDTMR